MGRIAPTGKFSIHYLLTFVKPKASLKVDVYIIFTNVKKQGDTFTRHLLVRIIL